MLGTMVGWERYNCCGRYYGLSVAFWGESLWRFDPGEEPIPGHTGAL
ncbi:hypothetical protein BH11ARM1_BH11ARM1_17250 [soil metagenome]